MEPIPPPPPTPGPLPPGQFPPGYYPNPYPPPPKQSLLWLWILLGVLGVLFVVGILAAIAIPAFLDYSKKAKRVDAELAMRRLERSLHVHYLENAAFPTMSAPPTPTDCCRGPNHKCAPDASLWTVEPWSSLDFSIDESTFFSYAYEVDPSGQRVTIRATGDLDCDGTTATYYEQTLTARDGNFERGELVRAGGRGD